MQTLAFDGRMGASGDMLLGALLAAGADRNALAPVEHALPVEYVVETVDRAGISATRVHVIADEESHDDHEHDHEAEHAHPPEGHAHDHADGHTHGGHDHVEGTGPSRSYEAVVELIEGLALPAGVTSQALAIVERLGRAEAAVHGTELTDTHFHEVGADDAIADIVGTCLLVADLDVDRIVTTPLATGGGTVEMAHGTYPVPPPAVVELAESADWAIVGGPEEVELLTPTGAAILAELADGVTALPSLRITDSGYGAGGRDFVNRPNVLRAIRGEASGTLTREPITVLETAVDDVSPEVLGGLQDTLTPVGARDVSITPLTMKKSRPGHLVTVICKPADATRVARRLAEETGTLGVRERQASHRWVADRRTESVSLDIEGEPYEIDVKVGADSDGTVFDVSAEYDDARRVAEQTGRPIREIQRRAEATWQA